MFDNLEVPIIHGNGSVLGVDDPSNCTGVGLLAPRPTLYRKTRFCVR